MEYMKTRFCLQLLVLALCCSCGGSHQVKGESPFIRISSMNISEDMLTAEIDIHNINDVKMEIDAIDIKIMGENVELVHYDSALDLTVDPNTTEEISLRGLPKGNAIQLLNDVESGRTPSLPFMLEGRVHTQSDGYLPFKNEGHLYRVPGKPGQFRSASSRSREQR